MSELAPDMDLTKSDDIQGLVFYSYKDCDHAGYCLFRITDRVAFQGWLSELLERKSIAAAKWAGNADTLPMNIAFTASGLECLLGNGWISESYDVPFVEGMVTDHRSRLLGDVEENDPGNWLWGREERIDGLLIAFGNDQAEVKSRLGAVNESHGAEIAFDSIFGDLDPSSARNSDSLRGKEPFGFADGISQPIIIGTKRYNWLLKENSREAELHGMPAGEFVLGYPDGSGTLPRSPATVAECDPNGLLEAHWEWPERRDFGKHGTYLVIRQLAQDVEKFWDYLEAEKAPGETAQALGAKLFGRRMDGATLEPVPQSDKATNNLFDFSDDPDGLHCPLGSHIRRANPRSFGTEDPEQAKEKLKVTNRHRILRRGRVYTRGERVAEGLLFLCLNASINRQFEFVQSTWCNNQFFHGLEREVDPTIGTVRAAAHGLGAVDRYTIPSDPYRRVLSGLKQFVTVKGGAYFFLPGMNALKLIAQAP